MESGLTYFLAALVKRGQTIVEGCGEKVMSDEYVDFILYIIAVGKAVSLQYP